METKNYSSQLNENKTYLIALFLFSVLFVLVYSTSTSFLYSYPDTCDSFIFQTIGKFWVQGALPYRDLFDNKGPFLYAMNALGYWLTDSRVGLLFVQVFFFFILSVITFRFLQLGFPRKQSFWLSVILLSGLSFGYTGGNNGCEYGMPLLVLSPYLFYKWFQQSETANGHPYRYSFVYGLTIGLCLLTRASNALIILMMMAYVLVHELNKKRIKSFFFHVISAMTGCLVICLPFVLYFWANDALDDLYDSEIVTSLKYLQSTGLMTPLMHLKRAVALFCAYANVLAFVFLGILQLSTPNPKRMHGVLWFSMGIGCILFFICTNCYPNYAHICFPFAIIALLELKRLYQESGFKKHVKALVASLTIFILAINLFNGVYRATQLILHDSSAQKALYSAYDEILSELPKESNISFIGYDILPEMYLRWNLRPHYRFFALHTFSRNYNIELYEETQDEFLQGDAQWILVNYKIGLPKLIRDFLAEKYERVKIVNTADGELVLYRRG